jgi:DNA-binding response OmpR family regulator
VGKGLEKIQATDYDCIVLDNSLPDGNGVPILKNLYGNSRASGVIVISAKGSLNDRVAGLNLGADDYLVKPFALSELNARIAALVRRKRFRGQNHIVVRCMRIDLAAKTVMVNQTEVDLTRTEFDLLLYMVSNRNRVILKLALAEIVSGEVGKVYESYDFVYSHIKNLKRKLAGAGSPEYIKSVYGMGYRFTG